MMYTFLKVQIVYFPDFDNFSKIGRFGVDTADLGNRQNDQNYFFFLWWALIIGRGDQYHPKFFWDLFGDFFLTKNFWGAEISIWQLIFVFKVKILKKVIFWHHNLKKKLIILSFFDLWAEIWPNYGAIVEIFWNTIFSTYFWEFQKKMETEISTCMATKWIKASSKSKESPKNLAVKNKRKYFFWICDFNIFSYFLQPNFWGFLLILN